MNQSDATMKWLAACPQVQQLYFQFSAGKIDDLALSPKEETIQRFIDGSCECRYVCELIWFRPASIDDDDINLKAMLDIEALRAWVAMQNELGNLPEFPEGMQVQEAELIDSGNGYVATNDGVKAKYIIPFALIFTKDALHAAS